MPFKFNPINGTLDLVNTDSGGTVTSVSLTPSSIGSVTNSTTTPNININSASATSNGYLSSVDWVTFNSKLDSSRGNYIINPDAETDVSSWNLYNDAGRTTPASTIINDLTFTSVAGGDTGNGINIDYIFHPTQSSNSPLVTVVSASHITIAWYNGPTLANNPTATQLAAAYNAVPGAVAIATISITGIASNRQYITGSHLLSNGGDTSPIDGTGGIITGVTFTRNISTPLVGSASFDLNKDGNSREGTGISTDFVINTLDKGQTLQISFAYSGSSGMILGSLSDVKVFIYDITNSTLIPVTPVSTIAGPVNTAKTFVGRFISSSNSNNYRLILHIATQNATSWDLLLDNFILNNQLTATSATQVPSVVLLSQPISGAVTDHMAVAWIDGANQWVPATSNYNGDYWGMFGFATNIVGSTASIYIHGYMDGFSFGPFAGYNQYVDPSNPGQLTPLPSPFTDIYLIMGKAISSTAINIQVFKGINLITAKGGLLSNAGANNGTGDQVLAVGSNGNVLVANSAAALGINWAPAVVASAPFTYTTSTRALTIATATNSVTGVLSAADHTTYSAYPTILAPKASPVFTGDINSSTGNILISTIGKGLQVKTGVNSKLGTATLVAGTVTVSNTSITANSKIFLTSNVDGGVPGWLRVSAKVNGTSFTITSSNTLDTSTVAWIIIESIP